jgi:hypothetical protein
MTRWYASCYKLCKLFAVNHLQVVAKTLQNLNELLSQHAVTHLHVVAGPFHKGFELCVL